MVANGSFSCVRKAAGHPEGPGLSVAFYARQAYAAESLMSEAVENAADNVSTGSMTLLGRAHHEEADEGMLFGGIASDKVEDGDESRV